MQASLKRFRSVQINNFFTPNPNQSQFQAAKAFTDGLTLAREAWKKFKITSLGIRRAKWARDVKELESFKTPEHADPVMDISDFRKAAIAFEGSADTVYWVEAFNAAQQKWVTVDPIATGTIGKPSRLEPPLSDLDDRDQVEDAELSRREAQEEMPKNVQDFKDHPYYVLERHLKHNEVIHPKREVGKVNVGTAANTNLEPIYRRRDVHQLKSADKWYRLGREIKPGEQPLKHAKPRRTRQQQPFPDEDENGEETLGAALYAPFQTELYVPPPCVRGRVPRNAFGNLDVYVPSMVPPGGLHVRDSRARLAARLLGIDHADAVTGFSFRGRHGTAVVEGAVVAAEFGDAVLAVLDGLRDLEQEEAEQKRSREALRLWRKFLLGLRVLERVQEYASADEKKQMEQEVRERVEAEEREAEMAAREQEMAGGFLLAEGAGDAPAEPTAGRMLAAAALDEDEYYDGGDGGGFLPDAADGEEVEEGEGEEGEGEEGEEGEGEVSDDLFKSGIMDAAPLRPRNSQQGFDGAGDEGDVPIGGGGFVPDEAEKSGYDPDEAGGFIPEDGDGFGPEGGGFVPEESSGGGGFIPEDGGGFVPEEGGGFIPDEEEGGEGGGIPKEDVPQASSLVAHGPPLETEPAAHKRVGGAIALASSATAAVNPATTANVEEVDTASRDQGDATRSTTTEIKGQEAALEARPQSNIGTQRSFGSDIPSDPISRPPLTAIEAGVPEQSSSDDEMDSLPSHDPDDEDAEPEWLAEEVVSD
ncbi:DNA repair protein Rad4 [Neofusicoccum parvum]|uniref:DNA repair protein Rad4 n=1 Tax=Neofusicoccum parvum TaxID=310453 RepID=A0ACB5RVM5_9PEZI|nr:DNA repair protein Rad4 [Neofusicoccum parvum]